MNVFLDLLLDFMDLHPDDDVLDALPVAPWNEHFRKSNEYAERCRIFANMCFEKGEFKFAIDYYNASLCYAPPGSENIPLCYGNRSAAFCKMGKYALALKNIELAKENGYPEDKIEQLNAREENCRILLEKPFPEKNSVAELFFKLSHPPNDKIPFIAGCLELRSGLNKGSLRAGCLEKGDRAIITNKDLKAGDIIAFEKPVFTWPNEMIKDPSCYFCTKTEIGSLLPCSHCIAVMFCSEKCKAKSALIHLNDELYGAYGEKYAKNLKMQLEAYRIAGGVDEALELLKNSEDKTIFDFDFSDSNDPEREKNMLIALNGLWKNPECLEITEVPPSQLLNIPPINQKPRTAEERRRLLEFIYGQCQILCQNFTQFNRHHDGIFLLHALVNNSCEPNVVAIKFGEKSVLIVTRPIKAGNQLLRGCNQRSMQAKTERLLMLESLDSICNCPECEAIVNDWPERFPKKDRYFVEPSYDKHDPLEAIEQLKKNCQYINKNDEKELTYEVARLVDHNVFLAYTIADGEILQLSNENSDAK